MKPIDPQYAVTRVPVVLSDRAVRDLQEFGRQFDGSQAVGALHDALRKGFPVPAVGPHGAQMPRERVRQRKDRAFEWDVLHPEAVFPDHTLNDEELLGDDDDPVRPLGARIFGYDQLHRFDPDETVHDRFLCLGISELLRKYRGGWDPADL